MNCPHCLSPYVEDCGRDYACRDCGTVIDKPAESATRAEASKESTTTPGSEATNKPNTPQTPTPKVEDSVVEVGGGLGECDACHKEVPVDELTASDYESNGVADGDFCDACRNYDGIGPSGHDRHEEVRGER